MNPIFAQIYKVDESTREVTGRASQETLDRDNEMMDYKTSKPFFQQWSAECFKDSAGASLGNVRSMHGNIAAGKLTDITFDDHERAIDVVAKIVDDNEWDKILEGVYLGFSIGGRYAKKWSDVTADGKVYQRYTAVPSEISIVDRPACPTAKFFSVHKRSGEIMRKRFKNRIQKTDIDFSTGSIRLRDRSMTNGLDAITKILAQGPQPFDPDFLQKFDRDGAVARDRTVNAIRKAHRAPLNGAGVFGPIDLNRRFAKAVTFPPQSANATSGGSIADTGATNNFCDETAPTTKPTRVGGQVVTDVSRSPNIDAALDAIKRDMSNPKRMGF